MRSARMVLATATATAALAIAAPAAYADHTGDGGHDDSSYSKEHDDSSYSKEHDKDGKHDKPHGGMHTGGGALAAVSEEDWGTAKDPKYDPETYKDKGDSQSEESWSGKQDKEWKHEKPRGGMHTGGGGLAEPGVTAGGLAALAVLGTGAYALRRKKVSGNVA
ncbi:hypothetical protein [Streptomyces capillispiralis]|uniref:MYXO-CTERM domain-containing protein n=1 Tax=Streptomyces capillispiralis TaxID=68182 RepID=A0A561TPU3_9ACTN|nr:hypothetical protein [Streptomyces capillispiralis]TWF89139.1 hypothetical protein FHX78_116181 [Streptomyces capillispiralis]GHH93409.1 hypothetical protein GCM10017779_38660 [Streptomyces capillispiralis]